MRVEKTLLQIFLFDRSSFKFSFGVMVGLAFSISVILATIGIMDGFVYGLKSALKEGQGDLTIRSRDGFFNSSQFSILDEELNILGVSSEQRTPMIFTEGFLLHGGQTRGVLVRGVEANSFANVTSFNLSELNQEKVNSRTLPSVVIGKKLAKDFQLSPGDDVTITFAQGSRQVRGLPLMVRLIVVDVVSHNIHEQDERTLYLDLSQLQGILGTPERFNAYSFNVPVSDSVNSLTSFHRDPIGHTQKVESFFPRVRQRLGWDFVVRPFWHDFSSLIEAVEVEKGMISLILQIIVLISVFNVVALIIYFNEKKARQIFLFQAMGMSRSRLSRAWLLFALLIWASASLVSLGFVAFFDWALLNVALLHLPSDVYHLGSLSLKINLQDYMIVFGATLIWILLVAWIAFFRMRRKSLLSGLREEFS